MTQQESNQIQKGRIFGTIDLVTLTNELEKQTHNNKQLTNYHHHYQNVLNQMQHIRYQFGETIYR